MPTGYKYEKSIGQYVKDEGIAPIDYSGVDLYNSPEACESWSFLISYWRQYPDKLLDLLESDNPLFYLEPIQRMNIRAFFRYQHAFITGSRGLTKSTTAFPAKLLLGILYPGIIMRYAAPTKEQMASIAGEKWEVVKKQWSGLASHWEQRSAAKDTFELRTKFGSVLTISVERGNDCHSISAEEIAQEESGKAFDFERFANAVLPTARVPRMVNRERDPFFPHFQKNYITSAGSQQNAAYEYRKDTFNEMVDGKDSICIDYPWTVAVLSGIREVEYYSDLRKKQTPEAQLREIESIWTGSSDNPIIRDSVLTESKTLSVMENRHCGNPNVVYVLGYDVSYAEGANNAKCATSVIKCEQSKDKDRFLKSVVYVCDNPPPRESMMQARQLKDRWYRFCLETGKPTYIAIDAASYGRSVLEDLHKDLGDGLPPLCCINHDLREIELYGALPVIHPIRAVSGLAGSHDSDGEMIKYAELEFEHRNIRLLCSNLYDGIKAYKNCHGIKDDSLDTTIAIPYIKTREMCGQIANLRKKASGITIREERISKAIQRDMWSATKYALRVCQMLEHTELLKGIHRESEWTKFLQSPTKDNKIQYQQQQSSIFKPRFDFVRTGGNKV